MEHPHSLGLLFVWSLLRLIGLLVLQSWFKPFSSCGATKRLVPVPDPSIAISDLMTPLETMFHEMGSWDIFP